MNSYDSFAELPASVQADLADWLLVLADSKQVLGLRYAEWCTGAPELEADVAISAMAQYELGHARLLLGALADLPDPRGPERDNDPGAWRSMAALDHPAANWTEVVALNALVDALLTVNMQAATEGGLRPLAQRLRKAVSEETYHTMHARAWFARLLEGPDAIAAQLHAAVQRVWPECVAWFGPAADNAIDRLAAAGVLDAGAAELRQRFLAATSDLFAEAPTAAGGNWSGWQSRSRRRGRPSFDAGTFAMLTGAHARAMGVVDRD